MPNAGCRRRVSDWHAREHNACSTPRNCIWRLAALPFPLPPEKRRQKNKRRGGVVSRQSRRGAGRDGEADRLPPEGPTPDPPLADQIIQQLTRRGQTDEV